jgi:hypothetical protein
VPALDNPGLSFRNPSHPVSSCPASTSPSHPRSHIPRIPSVTPSQPLTLTPLPWTISFPPFPSFLAPLPCSPCIACLSIVSFLPLSLTNTLITTSTPLECNSNQNAANLQSRESKVLMGTTMGTQWAGWERGRWTSRASLTGCTGAVSRECDRAVGTGLRGRMGSKRSLGGRESGLTRTRCSSLTGRMGCCDASLVLSTRVHCVVRPKTRHLVPHLTLRGQSSARHERFLEKVEGNCCNLPLPASSPPSTPSLPY